MFMNLGAVLAALKTIIRHYWIVVVIAVIALLGCGIGWLVVRGMS